MKLLYKILYNVHNIIVASSNCDSKSSLAGVNRGKVAFQYIVGLAF